MNVPMPLSIAEKLKQLLEQEILTLKLKPGERLDETKLAERYGTSRTPVREALRHLAAEGFVSLRTHRGAIVAGLSISELVDMFEMMAVYEGVCARLAATRATPEEMEQILGAHETCRAAAKENDFERYYQGNAHFHETLYCASHNCHLIKQTVTTRNRLGAYRRFQLRRNNRLPESYQEHEAVIAAMRRGDAEAADRAMREHITGQAAHITSLIGRLPPEYFTEPARNPAPTRAPATYPPAALAFE
jgi:DNA-binding GntR family transcriptional regulator